ncbi:esterase-like activity of phytase family protein [Rhodoligotrophos defluvii]|uniref:esterase-like activity of phytase family protein n=1 Tax=Rhodoligotrophos defluvii TaxID=2561934 RepID=UPI0010C9E859|nr:esterase-like activity of phytase family protein [Rhodoligotrophos defluvii]
MRRFAVTAFLIASFTLALLVGQSAWLPAQDAGLGPITVRARPIEFTAGPGSDIYGKLAWRGGLELSSSDPRFGGFSGMIVTGDGRRLLAVSDEGWWLRLAVDYRNSGMLVGVSDAEMGPILNAGGRREGRKYARDAEALTALSELGPDGPVAVGFENRVRIERYDLGKHGLAARAEPGPAVPDAIRKGPRNAQLESLARFTGGPFRNRLLAISEHNRDKQGNIRAWLLGPQKPIAFSFAKLETFSITDAVILPNQDIVTLERDFSQSDRRLRMALRRFSSTGIKPGATLQGEVLLIADWPQTSIDNMEALATYRSAEGEQRLLIMSDDNYNGFLQRTLLLQFALTDKVG